MPVNTPHPEYDARKLQWDRCADVIEGSDAIKAKREAYLPRLEGQKDNTAGKDAYTAYLMRALFYNATSRTVEGLTGLVFRKESQLDTPLNDAEEDALLTDITLTGVSFDGFAKTLVRRVIGMGRCGILVDMPPAIEGQTQGRAFMQLYDPRDIINWQTRRINGKMTLIRAVLYERATINDPDDLFVPKQIPQYRELCLNAAGQYEVNIWREKQGASAVSDNQWEKVETINPVLRGSPLDYIPFIIVNATNVELCTDKPPLIDMIDVNLSHYRSSADLEHARHYVALPTPWVAGFDASTELRIGSGTAWVSSDPNAKVGLLEFMGGGLTEMRNALLDKQAMMAVLGARLLEEKISGSVEAADTIRTRQSGEQSVLRSLAHTVSHALTVSMNWLMPWLGANGTAKVELNKDFIDTRLTPQEQTALMLAYQGGTISFETYFWCLQRGEMMRPGITSDEEKALIDAQKLAEVDLTDPSPDPALLDDEDVVQ